jgi:NADP-dependent aldehyde dehydrogenase
MPALETFRKALALEIENDQPAEMLHTGIFQNYVEKRANALAQAEVELLATAKAEPLYNQGVATIASTSAANFLQNPVLHREVFGPWSLIIQCDNMKQMEELAGKLEGQLTATLMATRKDLEEYPAFLEKAIDLAGRVVMNGVPTGVEVSQAMMHGGPYPATTDSRFTAVGADGIMRFVRPVAFQNWEPDMLPEYLR